MIKESELVLCTVKKIDNTTVFVDMEPSGTGSIIFSEIAAGRIRNIRDYVSPGRKMVCKILKVNPGNTELSLRRVTSKEREEFLNRYEKERNFIKMIKASSKSADSVLEKIKKDFAIPDFVEKASENPDILSEYMNKEDSAKLAKILSEKKEKAKTVKKSFILSSESSSGIKEIKEILNIPDAEIHYLGSSKFSVECSAKNFKDAEKNLSSILSEIEKRAKIKHCFFEIKEK